MPRSPSMTDPCPLHPPASWLLPPRPRPLLTAATCFRGTFGCFSPMSQVMTPQSPDDPGEGSPRSLVPKTQRPGIVASRGHGSDTLAVTKVNTLGTEGGQPTSAGNRTRSPEEPGATRVDTVHTAPAPPTSDARTEDACFPWPCVQLTGQPCEDMSHQRLPRENGPACEPHRCRNSGYGHVMMSRWRRRLKPLTRG